VARFGEAVFGGRRGDEGGEEEEEEAVAALALARREMGWDVSAFVWVAQVGRQRSKHGERGAVYRCGMYAPVFNSRSGVVRASLAVIEKLRTKKYEFTQFVRARRLILRTEKAKIQILPGICTILLVVRQFVRRSIAYIQNYNKKLENN
jgi:hypothetical protein